MSKLDFSIRVAGIVENSIVDGPGLRYTVFTQGCTHNCKGCHNPHTHDMQQGKWMDAQEIVEAVQADSLIKGITFSGGEPFLQADKCAALAEKLKYMGKDVITYTGFVFEELLLAKQTAYIRLLEQTDILIDGPFVWEQRNLNLLFRGSSNQRILNCSKSMELGKAVEFTNE